MVWLVLLLGHLAGGTLSLAFYHAAWRRSLNEPMPTDWLSVAIVLCGFGILPWAVYALVTNWGRE